MNEEAGRTAKDKGCCAKIYDAFLGTKKRKVITSIIALCMAAIVVMAAAEAYTVFLILDSKSDDINNNVTNSTEQLVTEQPVTTSTEQLVTTSTEQPVTTSTEQPVVTTGTEPMSTEQPTISLPEIPSKSFCGCWNNIRRAYSCTEYPLSSFLPQALDNNTSLALHARRCAEKYTAPPCVAVNPDFLSEYCIPCTQTYTWFRYPQSEHTSCNRPGYDTRCDRIFRHFENDEIMSEDGIILYPLDITLFNFYEYCYGRYQSYRDVPAGLSCPTPLPGVSVESFCGHCDRTELSSCTDYPLSYFSPENIDTDVSFAIQARRCAERYEAIPCIAVNPALLPFYCVPCTQTYSELKYNIFGSGFNATDCNAVLEHFVDSEEVFGDGAAYIYLPVDGGEEVPLSFSFMYDNICYGRSATIPQNPIILDVPAGLSCPTPLPGVSVESFCGHCDRTELSSCTDYPLSYFSPENIDTDVSFAIQARRCAERYEAIPCIAVNPALLPFYCVPCTQTYSELKYNMLGSMFNATDCNAVLEHFVDSEEVFGDGAAYIYLPVDGGEEVPFSFSFMYDSICYGRSLATILQNPIILDVPEGLSCTIAESCIPSVESFCGHEDRMEFSSCTEHPLSSFQAANIDRNTSLALHARRCNELYEATTCIAVNPDLLPEYCVPCPEECVPCTEAYSELRYDIAVSWINATDCNAVLEHFVDSEEVRNDGDMYGPFNFGGGPVSFTFYWIFTLCYGRCPGSQLCPSIILDFPAGLSCPIAESCTTSSPTPGM